MTKRMLIDDTQPEETRVVIVDGNKVEDVEFESASRKQIKGNIYTAKIIRIEPSLQAAFIDYGGNKHGFLAFNEIHPDYYNVSDEVRKEVEAEVDEIIAGKIRYLKEREAERARFKAEKEAQEARRRMEAQQAHEVEEAQLEPAQNVQPENDEYLNIQATADMMHEPMPVEANSDTAEEKPQEKAPRARRSFRKRKNEKNESETVDSDVSVVPETVAESPSIPTVQETAIPTEADIETTNDGEETAEDAKPRKHRKSTRRPRDRKKTVQTQAETAGLEAETLEDEVDDDLDSDDEDDIEDTESGVYNFETQRKLLPVNYFIAAPFRTF